MEVFHQCFLIMVHDASSDKGFEPILAEPAFFLAISPESLLVGVPDPLADPGQPAFAALGLDVPDELVVGERIQPAEDLADHSYERAVFRTDWDGEERLFDPAEVQP